MNDFPQRPKPWKWDVSLNGDAYGIADANNNLILTVADDYLDREQDLDHIVDCVNEHERLKARIHELEQQHPAQQPVPRGMEKEWQRKTELEQKLVKLEVYRFEFGQLTQQVNDMERYEDFLNRGGKGCVEIRVVKWEQERKEGVKRKEQAHETTQNVY